MLINTQTSLHVKTKSYRVASGRPSWTNNPQVDDRDLRLADMRGRLEIEVLGGWTLILTRHSLKHYGFPRLSDMLFVLDAYGKVRVEPELCAFGEIIQPRRLILVGEFDELAPLLVFGRFPIINTNKDGKHIAAVVKGRS